VRRVAIAVEKRILIEFLLFWMETTDVLDEKVEVRRDEIERETDAEVKGD
jgi:hypothetical protein